jgi:DNA-binding transcriptional regulator YhcF (GntR family)
VFRQIYLRLRSAILSGAFRPGTKLPSTRELAAQLGVSRPIVISVFEQLLPEGYTFGKKGAGTYVAADLPEPFGTIHHHKKRPVSVARTAASPRNPGGFVDVTTQSDERPFNLGARWWMRAPPSCGENSASARCAPLDDITSAMPIQAACSNCASPFETTCGPHARFVASTNRS